MLRADELTVVHPDGTTSEFTDVRYALHGGSVRILTAGGDEKVFPDHAVFTCHATRFHPPPGIPGG